MMVSCFSHTILDVNHTLRTLQFLVICAPVTLSSSFSAGVLQLLDSGRVGRSYYGRAAAIDHLLSWRGTQFEVFTLMQLSFRFWSPEIAASIIIMPEPKSIPPRGGTRVIVNLSTVRPPHSTPSILVSHSLLCIALFLVVGLAIRSCFPLLALRPSIATRSPSIL